MVVTLKYEDGLAIFLPDERRWVVSHPQRHYQRGRRKERATGNRFKRTVRMFKATRNRLINDGAINERTAPSYFIECLLYNVPERLFSQQLSATYMDILNWIGSAQMRTFATQSGDMPLFGSLPEQWTIDEARRFMVALRQLWDGWR